MECQPRGFRRLTRVGAYQQSRCLEGGSCSSRSARPLCTGRRLILGSVSQRVLYEASCSVRVARARRGETDAPLRIVIGVDGSPYSNGVVDAVYRREWPTGTEVRLVAVVDTLMAITPEPSQPSVNK